MLISYVLRGEEVNIDVTDRREPYEWLIAGKTVDELNAMNITAEEEEAIGTAIHNALYDNAMSWCPEDDR